MLAAISDYFYWWQLPLLAIFFLVWFLGGWPLLWVGGRFIARARRATLGRSLLARLADGLVGFGVLVALPLVLGMLLGGGGLAAGILLAVPGSLLLGWLMIKLILATSYGRAILAWLPTLAAWLLTVPIWIAILMPTLTRAREMAKREICMTNLKNVSKVLAVYAVDYDGRMPPNLDVLVSLGLVEPSELLCPSDMGFRPASYFYLPGGPQDPPERIVACDYLENHRGEGRSVLFANANVRWAKEAEFQAELDKPRNADFAEALRAAEPP